MIGIFQGRLTQHSTKKLQIFPKNPFKEFNRAVKAKYNFIEFFAERKLNKKNPIWSDEGIKNYIKYTRENNLKIYSFVDDYFINHSLSKKQTLKYASKILTRVNLLGVKKYIVPLYGKSLINSKNVKKITENLSIIAKSARRYKIEVLLENNMSPNEFRKLKKRISSKNCYFVFDTGNRSALKENSLLDIKLFKNEIRHVHLKDKNIFKENVIIGKGIVNFEKVFSYLKMIRYKGSFTIESVRGTNIFQQAKKNYKYFHRLIKKNKI